jgi:hypothetical protein
MQARYGRSFVAALVALAALLIAHWLDAGVLRDAEVRAGITFDPGQLFNLLAVVHIVTAGGVIAVSLAAWRSKSVLAGVAYIVVGGFIVLLPALTWAFGTSVNSAPPAAPAPIASTIDYWYTSFSAGATGAAYTLAGAMLLSGIAVIWSASLRLRGATTVPPVEAPSVPEPSAQTGPFRP